MSNNIPCEEGYFRIPDSDPEHPVLLGSYSKAADQAFFPKRKLCPITSEPVEDCELPTEGVLYSWTYVEVPFMGNMQVAVKGGYGVGQIDLPGKVRIQSIIEGKQGDWEIGMPMIVKVLPVGKDKEGNTLCSFQFAPKKIGDGK